MHRFKPSYAPPTADVNPPLSVFTPSAPSAGSASPSCPSHLVCPPTRTYAAAPRNCLRYAASAYPLSPVRLAPRRTLSPPEQQNLSTIVPAPRRTYQLHNTVALARVECRDLLRRELEDLHEHCLWVE